MKKQSLSISLSRAEIICGICYLIISQLFLPSLLTLGNSLLAKPLSSAELNFVYYCVNFAVVVWLFRRYLLQSWRYALKIPFPVLWYAILGYLGCEFLTNAVTWLACRLDPGFHNLNNQSVVGGLRDSFYLMVISTVILVPVAEETLFRGVVFRGLYDKSRLWAYIVSCVLFSLVHLVGYIGSYSPIHFLLAFLQYLPAGYCLCWVYCQTGTIVTPMLMHALINAMSIYYSMR